MSGQTLGDLHCKPTPDILPSLSTCLSLGTLKHACIASAAQMELGRAGELHIRTKNTATFRSHRQTTLLLSAFLLYAFSSEPRGE